MTKTQTTVEKAGWDAQELHKKISVSIAKAEQATWADVKAVQDDIRALGIEMTTLVTDQAGDVKTDVKAAIAKLEAAGKLVENTAVTAKNGIKQANAAMLDSAHKAAQSLSAAVAEARTKLARAIKPKKEVA